MGWPITKPSTIYTIRCRANGKVYIGRTCRLEKRVKEHFDELRKGQKTCCDYANRTRIKSHMQEDYDKYGKNAFEVYVLEEMVPPEKCKEREAHWIAQYNAAAPDYGYNKLTEQDKSVLPCAKRCLPPNRYMEERALANQGE